MDILDKPNLRLSAIDWAVTFFSARENQITSRWADLKLHYKEVIYWVCTLFYLFVVGSVVPYFVFTYLLAGLFGLSNSILTMAITLLAIILSSFSIDRELITRIRSRRQEQS